MDPLRPTHHQIGGLDVAQPAADRVPVVDDDHGVPYILAGSIRDDGPLPETMMDLVAAQDAYAKALAGVEVVVMLSSMLHSIGVGNMLPSWVKVVCVDINPAVVTKLSDRGSTQTIGIVTDVGLFLRQLAEALRDGAH